MSDIQEIRARFRDTDAPKPNSGGSIRTFLLLAVCGIAIGFAALWLMPHAYSISLSSLLKTFTAFWR